MRYLFHLCIAWTHLHIFYLFSVFSALTFLLEIRNNCLSWKSWTLWYSLDCKYYGRQTLVARYKASLFLRKKTSTSHQQHCSNCARIYHDFTCNGPKLVQREECFSSTAGQRGGSSSVRLYGCGIVRLLVRLLNCAKMQLWRIQGLIKINVASPRCFGNFMCTFFFHIRSVWGSLKRLSKDGRKILDYSTASDLLQFRDIAICKIRCVCVCV